MYSISEAADHSGISAYTLRYYEKIGLLPAPNRHSSGKRQYTESNLQFIKFLKSLKETGMALEDIQEFVKDGCIWERIESDDKYQLTPSVTMRIEILAKHLDKMESKRQELEDIITITKEKIEIYNSILIKEGNVQ